MEAAEAVANPEGNLDVLGGLTSLVEMSLVRLDETESEPRFRMLETIREYAVDRLIEANEDAAVRERHAEFYLAFAEAVEPELVRANQVEWLDRLDADGQTPPDAAPERTRLLANSAAIRSCRRPPSGLVSRALRQSVG